MSSPKFKTVEQIEFDELFARLGWGTSDVGRAIGVTPQLVSQYRSGKRNPTTRSLRDMRDLVARNEKGRAHVAQIEQQHEPLDNLEFLREHAPDQFQAAAQVLKVLRESVTPKGVNPGVAHGVDKVNAAIEGLVEEKRSELQSRKRKRKTGGQSGGGDAPPPAAGTVPTPPPRPPGPAPK